MSELKPCPFCGGEAEILGGPENWTPTFYDPDSGGGPIAVSCKTCACGLHFFDDYEEAITAWNRRAQPENKPLTLEELREMDGEPVWVHRLEDNQGWWVVIKSTERDKVTTDYGGYFEFADYGKTWLAYRRKPEEGAL